MGAAVLCWLNWLLQPALAPSVPVSTTFVTELLAQSAPAHRAFQIATALSGLLAVLAAVVLPTRPAMVGASWVLRSGLAIFGLGNIATAMTPLPCMPRVEERCRPGEILANGWHGWHFLAVLLSLGALWLVLSASWALYAGSSDWRRLGSRVLGVPALLLLFGSLLAPHGTIGLLQRIGFGFAAAALGLLAWMIAVPPAASVARADEPGKPWPQRFASAYTGLVFAAAGWSLISLVFERMTPRLVESVEHAFLAVNVPVGRSLFSVALLLIAGIGLQSRKRVVMYAVLVFWPLLGAVVAAAQLAASMTGSDSPTRASALLQIAQLLSGVGLTALFLVARNAFAARLAKGSVRRALAYLIGGLVLAVLVALLLAALFVPDGAFSTDRLRWAVMAATDLDPRPFTGLSGVAGVTIRLVAGLVAAVAIMLATAAFLRSAAIAREADDDAELIVRSELLRSPKPDSLGYFGTRRDVSVFTTPGVDGAIVYRVTAGSCLASGDPVGDRDSWPRLIAAWQEHAFRYGWTPGALSCSESGALAYTRAGMRALHLGDEAVVEVDRFDLAAPASAELRRTVGRLRRHGFGVEIRRQGEIEPDRLARLAELAHRWRAGDDGTAERGFTMALGRLGDPTDARTVVVVATDAEGREQGLLTFVPWGSRGLSLDLMLRDGSAANGITELMIVTLIETAPDLGVRRISLNFAVFRQALEAGDRIGATLAARLVRAGVLFASRFFQLDSLYRSNQRYSPTWVPRYICYDSAPDLTRIAVAATIAEGQLPGAALLGIGNVPPAPRQPDFPQRVAAQEAQLSTPVLPTPRYSEQERLRRDKLAGLAEPYPVRVPRDLTIGEALTVFSGMPPDTATGRWFSVAGRVVGMRDLGGVLFAVLSDDGERLQVLAGADSCDPAVLAAWRREVDKGDHVSVTGEAVTSRSGEPSIRLQSWTMAAKCLRPLPHRIVDPQAKVRQRYLDMAIDPEVQRQVRARSVAVRAIRTAFETEGFLEVETPMLQAIHGGANARPFVTRINAYNTDLYLRIAPELFLKRLCVGGMGRIFELNRNFRNEGADATHNPEFTSVEAYQAYADYTVMRELTRRVILAAAVAVHGEPVAVRPDGSRVDLSPEWPVVRVHDAVSRATGRAITTETSAEELVEICAEAGVAHGSGLSAGELVAELYDELVEGQTEMPTFYTDFPVETSPLTRRHRIDPHLAERWDLVAFGAELGTAYSELVDPVEQRRRLTEQSLKAAAGDPEAMEVDEDFLTALEYSMPPTGGLGIGVDRVVMMLTGTNIRGTIAFPFVKPQR